MAECVRGLSLAQMHGLTLRLVAEESLEKVRTDYRLQSVSKWMMNYGKCVGAKVSRIKRSAFLRFCVVLDRSDGGPVACSDGRFDLCTCFMLAAAACDFASRCLWVALVGMPLI